MGRRLIFMNMRKKCKKIFYFIQKAFKEKNVHQIAQLIKKDPKQFWRSVRLLINNTFQNKANCIHPNTWKPYFEKLLNGKTFNNNTSENIKDELLNIEKNMKNKEGPLDQIFNDKEILAQIKKLKCNKSNFRIVSNEMLKCNPKAITNSLCYIFNHILKTKRFQNYGISPS